MSESTVEQALLAADEARRSGYCYGHGWHLQVLANEVRAMRDEIARLRNNTALKEVQS
jgi:hypothetical protein